MVAEGDTSGAGSTPRSLDSQSGVRCLPFSVMPGMKRRPAAIDVRARMKQGLSAVQGTHVTAVGGRWRWQLCIFASGTDKGMPGRAHTGCVCVTVRHPKSMQS